MSSDSVNSYMPPCSSSAPGHDINMMWAWKVGCRYIREHPEECVPVRVEDVGDGGFGEVLFDGTATSTLQVIRPAWGGGAPCPPPEATAIRRSGPGTTATDGRSRAGDRSQRSDTRAADGSSSAVPAPYLPCSRLDDRD
jgi:hypothetical protein